MTIARGSLLCVALMTSVVACMPAHLKKYQKDGGGTDTTGVTPTTGAAPASTVAEKTAASTTPAPEAARASIYAVDKQTFRFHVSENDVWESALNVLLRNYNVTIVDKTTGIITTEWDSYYLSNAVYRNRVSMRVSRSSRGQVDVTVHNNVEKLKDASQAASGTVGAVWLPAEDQANEVARIVQNMALMLNQPPPVLPPHMAPAASSVAQDFRGDGSTLSR